MPLIFLLDISIAVTCSVFIVMRLVVSNLSRAVRVVFLPRVLSRCLLSPLNLRHLQVVFGGLMVAILLKVILSFLMVNALYCHPLDLSVRVLSQTL
jgi:hypothetical protein